jgi:hypothetical protein
MIRSPKIARLGRVAALLAGFLSVAGSFGLHPEPVAVSPAAPAQAEWAVPAADIDATPHVCLACLSHRSVPLPRLSSVVLAPRHVAATATCTATAPLARLESPPSEGRGPPALG